MNTVKPFDPQGLAHTELGASKLNKLVTEYNAGRIMPGGKGIRVSQNGTGVVISAVRQRQSATKRAEGAFYGIYRNDGDSYLQCGSVTGASGGSATVSDYKITDVTNGQTSADGTILYLVANVTGVVEDDLFLPGCNLNSASLAVAATVPDNATFTVASSTGNIYVEVGRWTDGSFVTASAAGNYFASGSVGYFAITKS